MDQSNPPLKWAVASSCCACVLLVPIFFGSTLIWLLNVYVLHRNAEHAGSQIGSNGVYAVALIALAAIGGFAYGCYEASVKKPPA